MALSEGFLTEKGPGGMPNWAIGLIGIGIAVVVSAYLKKGKASTTDSASTTDQATTAPQTPPTVFVVPGSTGAPTQSPPDVGRTDPTTPAPAGPTYKITGKGDNTLDSLISTLYKTPKTDTTEYSIIANAILAANPNRTGWGATIPTNTVVNLPPNYIPGHQVL